MIVGFDATTLVGSISGVGYYTARLIEGLAGGAGGGVVERILVFSNREVAVPDSPRIEVCREGRFPIRAVWMQLSLPRLLEGRRPDLVHYTNYLAPVWGKTPYVVSVHDMSLTLFPEYHTLKKRVLTSTLIPTSARRAELVLAPSESTRRDVVRLLGIPEDRVKMIPYAVGPQFRSCPDRGPAKSLVGDAPYLLYVGTIEPRKNLVRALRAFARIAPSYPEHRFLIVGQAGWLYEDVFQEAARHELAGRVVIAGYLPEEQLPALYSTAEALVYVSLYEGFGFPVLEAMACGTPVVTSRSSSLGELASDAALLVDPRDENALAEAMAAVCSDGALRGELRRKGLARAAEFTWERTARETAAAYAEAVDRRRGVRAGGSA